jgi:hypothetical protein
MVEKAENRLSKLAVSSKSQNAKEFYSEYFLEFSSKSEPLRKKIEQFPLEKIKIGEFIRTYISGAKKSPIVVEERKEDNMSMDIDPSEIASKIVEETVRSPVQIQPQTEQVNISQFIPEVSGSKKAGEIDEFINKIINE